jgi:hypothetical protein
MMFNRLLLTSALVLFSVFAQAQEFVVQKNGDVVYNDSRGMPRLLVKAEFPETGLLLDWSEANHYERKIVGVPVSLRTYTQVARPAKMQWQALETLVSKIFRLFKRKIVITPESLGTLGFDLDTRTKNALEQVKYGANEYRNQMTPEEYLSKFPMQIGDYTHERNRELTEKYGAGFSGSIYRVLLRSDKLNAETQTTVRQLFDDRMAGKRPEITEVTKGIKILVVKGYVQALDIDLVTDPESLDALVSDLKKMNIDIEIMPTKTGDPIHENAEIVDRELTKHLNAGEKVIILTVSKGVPEVLGGLAQMNKSGRLKAAEARGGKILGVLQGSGVVGGSMVANWASQMPQYLLSRYKLGEIAKEARVQVQDYKGGLKSMSFDYIEEFMASVRDSLPKDLYYLNFIGITDPRTGFASNTAVKFLQQTIMTRKIFAPHGANDGLAEYPGLGTDRNLTPNSATLTFNSDHSILPGDLDGINFREVLNRNTGMAAIFEFIIKRDELSKTMPAAHPVDIATACRSHFR